MNGTNIVEVGVDLSEFYTSVEWDILEVPAVRNEKFYTCCDEPYLDITFNITMRRKTLFYTVNLIIPCMGISFLTILVFYLPSDSGEKVISRDFRLFYVVLINFQFAGVIKHIHPPFAYCVLLTSCGNYSTDIPGCSTLRKICTLHNDTRYIQVSFNFYFLYVRRDELPLKFKFKPEKEMRVIYLWLCLYSKSGVKIVFHFILGFNRFD